MSDPKSVAAKRALEANPDLPVDADGPVFREPWEAQAFAIALTLHEKGVFQWSEWAEELGASIKAAQAAGDPDTGRTYYRHWLATLERMIAKKSVTTAADLTSYRNAWEAAAARTSHGQPIELQETDFTLSAPRAALPAGLNHPGIAGWPACISNPEEPS